jgi:lysophospholipase L1-like esterase
MKLLSLILVLFSLGCAGLPADPCKIITPGSSVNVWSFGDSITAGAGAGHACLGYQALFTEDIGANSQDVALSGTPLTVEFQFIMRLNYSNGIDINTLLAGFNDVSFYGVDPTHLALFEYDLTQSLLHLSSLGKMTLVGTTLYMSPEMQAAHYPMHTNSNVDQYVSIIKQVINQLQGQGFTNLYLVDTNAVFDPMTMSSSDFHPSAYGHQVLANAFNQVYQANK